MLHPRLSICIATFNRGKFIDETLNSILVQMEYDVELIVVDGASPDNTLEVMEQYLSAHPEIRYFRESENSGVDGDYDKAVSYAKGEYCWLMTDDDLLRPEAIIRVLDSIKNNPDLIVVNSEVKNIDFSKMYMERSLNFFADKEYRVDNREAFFTEVASYLSFIGGVVIKRELWMTRDRISYYGTLFIHVGVIFQNPPLEKITVLAEPLITIRYGNGMWSPRSFEIWTFKWPQLIWSFTDFSDKAKLQITQYAPHRSINRLFRNRALGAFSLTEIHKLWPDNSEKIGRIIALIISVLPPSLANFICVLYLSLSANPNKMALHDLLHSKHAGFLSKILNSSFKLI